MRPLFRSLLLLPLLAACRPDQVEHLSNTKELAVEAANWEVKRIMPKDLLRATRWAGDSLTRTAERELRTVLAQKLQEGGVAAALPYCRPETLPATDSLAKVLQASLSRVSNRSRNPAHQASLTAAEQNPADTTRHVSRPGNELFTYQRPLVLQDKLCLRCHGTVGQDIPVADYALIKKQYPQDQATGYQLGQPMGVWRVSLQRSGVAEHWTMKTRKVMKKRKPLF
ncbi:Tll0287-like domain-containing protein [Hymenobacter swuensis]|uniref:Tll0287-like domain-containing protein n=1 Tax=Hymenobacter swuensis DY53 TaxID=1227739 RepID=W8F1B2_9BACT|nr:DUF3365 domain-containing protein [Hymenobacter swuensis]AHJ95605.1 hypothetical protein Hsw_0010 [Hymenobacter swuensis DY53]